MGGTLRFSAIMQNQATKAATALPTQLYPRYGLLGGINISGPTAINDGLIGAATVHAASGQNYAQWTNIVPPNDGTLTMAVILRLTSTSGGFVCGSSTGGTTWAIMLSSGVPTFGIPFGTSASSGLPALQVGHAYFIACSTTSTTGSTTTSNKQTFVVRDLVTGITQTSQAATSVTLSAPTGGVQWGDAGGNNASSLGGYLAAMMFSNSFLTQQELRMWAQDPWSFWYPQANNNLVTLILESLSGPTGAMPKNQYDWPLSVGRQYSPATYREYNADYGSQPSTLLAGLKPFKQDDWPVPFPPFDERRGQWNRSYDQSMSISRQLLVKSPITGPTQELPAQPFRPQVSADLGSTQRLATIKAPITGPTQDLPIPPFRPQVSADQAPQQWQLNTIKAPITGPTQDLPIPPFRPQVSSDQGSTQRLATIQPPNPRFDWQLPQQSFRPQFSFDQGNASFLTVTVRTPFNQYDWPLPIVLSRIDQNYAQFFNPTQMLTGNKPLFQAEWPLPTPAFRPQFSFDQGNASFLTVTVTLPRNQYDWPLPFAPWRPQYGLVYNKAQQAGNQPFAQTEWPLPIPPFRPDVTFMPSAPIWLSPVVMPRNQYDWPLPILPWRLDQNYAQWFNPTQMFTGNKPFLQIEWPLAIPSFRPQFSFELPMGAILFPSPQPFNLYDWPLPQVPFRPQFSADYGTPSPYLTVVVLPRNQYDWPLPIPRFRIDQTWTFNYNPTQMLTGTKPFAQNEWPLTPPYPSLPVSFYQIGGPNNNSLYVQPPPSTVKIEWLIRARRRGRR